MPDVELLPGEVVVEYVGRLKELGFTKDDAVKLYHATAPELKREIVDRRNTRVVWS